MNAMKKAWEIRKEAAKRWSCKVSEIVWSECLKMAHAGLSVQKAMSQLEKIQGAVEKFSCTAKEWKGMVLIIDKKGKNIGHVKEDGTIVRKREGSKQLMGALIRDAINEVL